MTDSYVLDANALLTYLGEEPGADKIVANELWSDISSLPVQLLYTLDEDFVKTAARFKAAFRMSVADSFLLAQAHLLNAQVVTSDHHELDAVDIAGLINFYWYR
ncbi:MAG: hypothetical protein H7319_06590 [Spirosoma sp.]|nr:hypothetical protein [Spirosoma sp.]